MKASAVVDIFRSDVQDLDEPRLWSDEEAFGYLDDAQLNFCRNTGGLGDATSAVTRLSVRVDSDMIPLSDKILKLRGARRSSDGAPISVLNYEDMAQKGIRFDGRTGQISYLIIGMEPGSVRAYPVPSVVDTALLLVDRLPLCTVSDESPDEELEIEYQHCRPMTLWMRHLAYGKQHSEGYDKQKSAFYEAEFNKYCAKATLEKERVKHKTRVVAYGGL